MTADILKFAIRPKKIVESVELLTYSMVEQYFDLWRIWFAMWGIR